MYIHNIPHVSTTAVAGLRLCASPDQRENLWLLGVVNSVGGLGGYIAVSIANHTAWAPPVMFVGL